MKANNPILYLFMTWCLISMFHFNNTYATSQWSRATGLACSSCHTVFPRLNSFGEDFLKNGYQMMSTYKKDFTEAYKVNAGGVLLNDVSNILGFRLNMTPFELDTKSFQQDSGSAKTSKLTFGNSLWVQAFAAASIYKDISFFSELEYSRSSFKFNWFYFNFTNLLGSKLLNVQVGNISPMEFASFPNRLPQLPALKGETFLIKSSNGSGENSVDMSSARGGLQYFGMYSFVTAYAGVSAATSAVAVNQFQNYWGGLVLSLPENVVKGFEGSTLTLHYYTGTDTKYTGQETGTQKKQIQNKFSRFSPQLNIRYADMIDVQAALVYGTDENFYLSTTPKDFKYNGIALEAGFMPNESWHLGLHYDKYTSDDKVISTGKPVLNYQRVVPTITYIVNQNIRFTTYWENDITDKDEALKVNKLYLNMRVMF